MANRFTNMLSRGFYYGRLPRVLIGIGDGVCGFTMGSMVPFFLFMLVTFILGMLSISVPAIVPIVVGGVCAALGLSFLVLRTYLSIKHALTVRKELLAMEAESVEKSAAIVEILMASNQHKASVEAYIEKHSQDGDFDLKSYKETFGYKVKAKKYNKLVSKGIDPKKYLVDTYLAHKRNQYRTQINQVIKQKQHAVLHEHRSKRRPLLNMLTSIDKSLNAVWYISPIRTGFFLFGVSVLSFTVGSVAGLVGFFLFAIPFALTKRHMEEATEKKKMRHLTTIRVAERLGKYHTDCDTNDIALTDHKIDRMIGAETLHVLCEHVRIPYQRKLSFWTMARENWKTLTLQLLRYSTNGGMLGLYLSVAALAILLTLHVFSPGLVPISGVLVVVGLFVFGYAIHGVYRTWDHAKHVRLLSEMHARDIIQLMETNNIFKDELGKCLKNEELVNKLNSFLKNLPQGVSADGATVDITDSEGENNVDEPLLKGDNNANKFHLTPDLLQHILWVLKDNPQNPFTNNLCQADVDKYKKEFVKTERTQSRWNVRRFFTKDLLKRISLKRLFWDEWKETIVNMGDFMHAIYHSFFIKTLIGTSDEMVNAGRKPVVNNQAMMGIATVAFFVAFPLEIAAKTVDIREERVLKQHQALSQALRKQCIESNKELKEVHSYLKPPTPSVTEIVYEGANRVSKVPQALFSSPKKKPPTTSTDEQLYEEPPVENTPDVSTLYVR